MAKFFKILQPGCEERMALPGNFAQLLADQIGTAAKTVFISSPLGSMWHMKLRRDKRHTYFAKGWPEFLEAHEMQMGELMLFSYEGESSFSVEIFDKTTCIKKYNCCNGQKDSQAPDSQLAYIVSPEGSRSFDSYAGGDGSSEYTNERDDSESLYSGSQGFNSCDIESTVQGSTIVKIMNDEKGKKATIPSDMGKKTKKSDNDGRLPSGTAVNGMVNQRDRKSNGNSKKNAYFNASPAAGYTFKTISESYNFSYMPLKKAFCESSQYKLTHGMATVRNDNMEAFPVKYRICGNYNFIGKGWRKFCEANNVRRGDQCKIKIIGDNEFLVSFKHF